MNTLILAFYIYVNTLSYIILLLLRFLLLFFIHFLPSGCRLASVLLSMGTLACPSRTHTSSLYLYLTLSSLSPFPLSHTHTFSLYLTLQVTVFHSFSLSTLYLSLSFIPFLPLLLSQSLSHFYLWIIF